MTYQFFRLLRRADGLAVDNIATDAGQLEAISALTDGTGTLMECAGASCLLWHDAVLAAKSGPRTWRQPGPINSSASSHGKAGKRRHDAAAYVDQDFQLLTAPDAKRLARGINASVGAYPPFPSLGLLDPRLDTMDWNELQRSNRSPVTTMAQRLTNEAGRRQLRDLSAFFRRGPFFIGPVEAVGQRSEDSFEGRLLLAAPSAAAQPSTTHRHRTRHVRFHVDRQRASDRSVLDRAALCGCRIARPCYDIPLKTPVPTASRPSPGWNNVLGIHIRAPYTTSRRPAAAAGRGRLAARAIFSRVSDGDELARQRRDGVRNEARKLGQERPDPAVIPQRKGDLPEHPASQPACEDEIVERSADTRHIWFPNRPDYEHLGPDALEVLDDFAWTIYGLRAGRT